MVKQLYFYATKLKQTQSIKEQTKSKSVRKIIIERITIKSWLINQANLNEKQG